MSDGLIEFQTGNIRDIGSTTMGQQAEWDSVWERCRSRISSTAAEALDQATGSSLEQRNQEYHQKSAAYAENVGQQGRAVNQIGDIATDTNQNMVRTISG
jgi:hypothetical protein